ncbi:MAG TPA: RNA-directed DNA polymerase [Gallionellaceae bacterium]|nr:RNA-directed DNA polymerase [Gallionellaceae bacterium]
MKRARPGILAVRAVNQYRRRDVLTYLALRYYLHNDAARTDLWARQVATSLVLTRTDLPYFHAHHFKDLSGREKVDHRAMFLPCANEALAEAALLAECAKHPQAFSNSPNVFSYPLNHGDDRSGIFPHYSAGLRGRHDAIAKACDDYPDGIVRYIDIKRFYPSISPELARTVWKDRADVAGLGTRWRELGEKLIDDHGKMETGAVPSILTGPMFSHLIGNLVLRQLDEDLAGSLPVRYFRYVDDITLVGSKQAVEASMKIIRARLSDLDLLIHEDWSPKSLELPTKEWIGGRNDYQQSRRKVSWITLIGDLKRFLLANPEEHQRLHQAFRSEGFRIPVPDYSSAIFERTYLENVQRWVSSKWFRRKVSKVSIDSLLQQARWLRTSYESEFNELLDGFGKVSAYERKRRLPKLRYRAGRLSYLANEDVLTSIAAMASTVPELHLQSLVMLSTASGNIDQILGLGTNAAQAAAQPMRASGKSAKMSVVNLTEAEEQALAVFRLNGVEVEARGDNKTAESELLKFAESGSDGKLMTSNNAFIREIACLHGNASAPRHPEMLESVFDEDEDFAIDAVEQLQQSLSP